MTSHLWLAPQDNWHIHAYSLPNPERMGIVLQVLNQHESTLACLATMNPSLTFRVGRHPFCGDLPTQTHQRTNNAPGRTVLWSPPAWQTQGSLDQMLNVLFCLSQQGSDKDEKDVFAKKLTSWNSNWFPSILYFKHKSEFQSLYVSKRQSCLFRSCIDGCSGRGRD